MINVQNLDVRLGGRDILEGADLEVESGETVALMGVSGSGKSTLLRAIVGLVQARRGRIELEGMPVTGVSRARVRAARRSAGMLFQGNALFDSMTVFDNIGFTLREVLGISEREIRQKVEDLLDKLKLGSIGHLYPSELSGGMKKRVGIARAIAHGPRVLLYDDPTAGLDPITSEVIARLIAEVSRDSQRTALVVTNYMPLVKKAASRAVILENGSVRSLGSVADLDLKSGGGLLDTPNGRDRV